MAIFSEEFLETLAAWKPEYVAQAETINTVYQLDRFVRDVKEEINSTLRSLNELQRACDAEILRDLEDSDTEMKKVDGNTAVQHEDEVVNVTDWNEFNEYMKENDRLFFLQRRVLNGAVLDALQAGEEIPGIEVVKLKKLGFRRS